MKNVKKTWAVLALLGCMQVLHAQTVYLHSDNPQMKWKLKPQAEVGTDVKSLCGNGYNVSAWVDAIVLGTAFNSYVIAGLEKDPNFGDNIHQVNRDKYDRSFWYRTTFRVPADFTKELIWLNFNGVNRRAEVYLNGTLLGKLDGFMHRGHFNVTSIVNRDKENVLAVLVHMPDTPLANQGSPTYLSSGGWDWMPYVPGLNSGITDKVFLTNTGTATLIDPWIRTNLPTRARADLSVALDVKNNSVEKTKVLVRGTITPGNIVFQKELDVNAHTTEQVKFDKRYFPQLCIDQPRLWWPNGYGDPNLYHCKFEVMVDGRVSETKDVSFGIKKYSYDKEGNTFHIYINDIPVFVKGANWGMSEYMLRCRGAEYDTKVRLHKEMNFNMIRNWLGSVTDDEFYEACDKYGIMTWMGQSAYPSMVWQTYDYYYDLTGAFWGAKSACEPVHILWNPVTDGVKIANTTACDMEGLTAEVKVYNLDGKSVEAYTKSAIVNSPSNSTVQCFTIDFNKERKNLSLNKPTFASSTTYGQPSDATDGKKDTRWAAAKAENEWLYVDLGSVQPIGGVRLDWEASFGKGYKIQVSDDTETWKEVYKTDEGRGGIDEITFPEVDARYVRMFGTELGWWFGYSLWSFDVLGGTQPSEGLSDVHFIRLTLKDKSGKIVSENNYWRGNDRLDFTALNTLPKAELKTSSKLIRKNGEAEIQAAITLPKSAKGVAFAVHVQAVRASDGERILPALMNDNYFTLMPGETKNLSITFDENLLQGDKYKLVVTPYNNK